jgi:hypothetical protein
MATVESEVYIDQIKEEHINKVKELIPDTTAEIPYRDWMEEKKKAQVYKVPLEYCKFRKENGRIRDVVLSYEKTKTELDANDDEAQKTISEFLAGKDPKGNENLKKLIKAEGQRDPAVMTADGFIVNGNRRKFTLDQLYKTNQDDRHRFLKVVILPGTDKADRPTSQDIAKLENKYESQETGKSPFSRFNKALTYIYNERHLKIPLATMLATDKTLFSEDEKVFKKAVKDYEKKYIEPVKIMEQYLSENDSIGDYKKVTDKYASFQEVEKIFSNLKSDKFLIDHSIDPSEVGIIKTAIFNIVKVKDHADIIPRHNELIREIPKWIKNNKSNILNIGKIDHLNKDPNIADQDENDRAWEMYEEKEVIKILKKSKNQLEKQEDQESPLDRLKEIIKKLKHKDLKKDQIEHMLLPDVEVANKLATEIQTLSKEIASIFYDLSKRGDLSKLVKKHQKKN